MVDTAESGSRGRGFEPHSCRRVVSLSKTYLPLKSTGNKSNRKAMNRKHMQNFEYLNWARIMHGF